MKNKLVFPQPDAGTPQGERGITLLEYYVGQAIAGEFASQGAEEGFITSETDFEGLAKNWVSAAEAAVKAVEKKV